MLVVTALMNIIVLMSVIYIPYMPHGQSFPAPAYLPAQENVDYVGKVWMPARGHVRSALESLKSVHSSGQIMRLDVVCPWKEHLYQLEKELALPNQVLFCLFKDEREGKWRIQAVSVSATSFDNRRSMPSAWRGLRDEKLSEVAGIPGCVFCHANGFIGGETSWVDYGSLLKHCLWIGLSTSILIQGMIPTRELFLWLLLASH